MSLEITAVFLTDAGTPATDLDPLPTIRIRDILDGSLVITDQDMTNIGDGGYKYVYGDADDTKDYLIRCDGGATLTGNNRYAWTSSGAISVTDILSGVIEDTLTVQNVLRILLSALAGKASGGGTTEISFRDVADSKDRITATVDTNGNRSDVTLDGD